MSSNIMTPIEIIQTNLPSFYKKYVDDGSVLFAVINALSCNNISQQSTIDRMNNMIGIDTTNDEDLEYRWGSLLNCPRYIDELYSDYRTRLKLTFISLVGGTAESIQYAAAYSIGLTNQDDVKKFVKIYDGWNYDGDIPVDESYKTNGHAICIIDTSLISKADDMEYKIISNINKIKASGIKVHIIFTYSSLYDIFNFGIIESFDDYINIANNILNDNSVLLNSSFKLNYESSHIGG